MYLDDSLLLSIDQLADAMGMSRNAAVVWCLQHCQTGMDEISKAARNFEQLSEEAMSEVGNAFGHSGWILNDELTRILKKGNKSKKRGKSS